MASDTGFDALAIFRALNARDVNYVVVGGFAVAAHGVIRATVDVDIVVDYSWQNAERLAQAVPFRATPSSYPRRPWMSTGSGYGWRPSISYAR